MSKEIKNLEENLTYHWFVQNRSTIEDAIDYMDKNEQGNILLLSHIIYQAVDKQADHIGRTTGFSEALSVHASTLSCTDILAITMLLIEHYQDYRTPGNEDPIIVPPLGIPLRKDCTCPCHEPGVQMVHCMPCCY